MDQRGSGDPLVEADQDCLSLKPRDLSGLTEAQIDSLRDPARWKPEMVPVLHRAITELHKGVQDGISPRIVLRTLLEGLLDITCSEYGFVGEHIWDEEKQQPYLKTHVLCNLDVPMYSVPLQDMLYPNGLKFYNLDSLFGRVIQFGEVVISNDPVNDPRSAGTPPGHPPLHSYLGHPIYLGKQIIGSFGVANRPTGYTQEVVDFIQPYLTACANILAVYSMQRTNQMLEAEIRKSTQLQRSLMQKNQDMQWFRDTTLAIRRSLNVQTVLNTSVEAIGSSWRECVKVCCVSIAPTGQFDLKATWTREGSSEFCQSKPLPTSIQLKEALKVWELDNGVTWLDQDKIPKLFFCHRSVKQIAIFMLPENSCGELLFIVLLNEKIDDKLRVSNLISDVLTQVVIAVDQSNLIASTKTMAVEIETSAEISKAKSDFLATMSHELRTPLFAVIANTSILEASTDLDPHHRDMVETIRSSTDLLLSIVNDILDYSKLESRAIVLDPQPVSLVDLLESCLDVCSPRALENKIYLDYWIDQNAPECIVVDDVRLKQIIINLVGNSLKFTQDGQVQILVSSSVLSESDSENLVLSFKIIDTGIGIAAENIPKLFERFSQADSSITRKFGGAGLGLAICKKLVNLMGGEISVESELTLGSIFSFTIQCKLGHSCSPRYRRFVSALKSRVSVLCSNEVESKGLVQKLSWLGFEVDLYNGLDVESKEDHEHVFFMDRDSFEKSGMSPDNVICIDWMLDKSGRFRGSLQRPVRLVRLKRVLKLREASSSGDLQAIAAIAISGFPSAESDAQPLIMVVDDNKINLKVTQKLVECSGFCALNCLSGYQAIEEIKNRFAAGSNSVRPILVLMDIHMPKMDGKEAAKIIRSIVPSSIELPILAMTASMTAEELRLCIDAGMEKHYISKPTKLDSFREVLRLYWKNEMIV